jgi:hypothetical protein
MPRWPGRRNNGQQDQWHGADPEAVLNYLRRAHRCVPDDACRFSLERPALDRRLRSYSRLAGSDPSRQPAGPRSRHRFGENPGKDEKRRCKYLNILTNN